MYANILVPVAYDLDYDPTRQLQAAQALSIPDALVTLLHVMDPLPPYAITFMTPAYREGLVDAIAADMAARAAHLPNLRTAVTEGHAGRAILRWADDHGNDCIVMASHRPGMRQVLLGSTATHVVQRAPCAVHVLR